MVEADRVRPNSIWASVWMDVLVSRRVIGAAGPHGRWAVALFMAASAALSCQGGRDFSREQANFECAAVDIYRADEIGRRYSIPQDTWDRVCEILLETNDHHGAFTAGLSAIAFIPDLKSGDHAVAGSYLDGEIRIDSEYLTDISYLAEVLIHELGHHWHQNTHFGRAFSFTDLSFTKDAQLNPWSDCGEVHSGALQADFAALNAIPSSCQEDVAISITAFFNKHPKFITSQSPTLDKKRDYLVDEVFPDRDLIPQIAEGLNFSKPHSPRPDDGRFAQRLRIKAGQLEWIYLLRQGQDLSFRVERWHEASGWTLMAAHTFYESQRVEQVSLHGDDLWVALSCEGICDRRYAHLDLETGAQQIFPAWGDYTVDFIGAHEDGLFVQVEGHGEEAQHHYLAIHPQRGLLHGPVTGRDLFSESYAQVFSGHHTHRVGDALVLENGQFLFMPRHHAQWIVPLFAYEDFNAQLAALAPAILRQNDGLAPAKDAEIGILRLSDQALYRFDVQNGNLTQMPLTFDGSIPTRVKDFIQHGDDWVILEEISGQFFLRRAPG